MVVEGVKRPNEENLCEIEAKKEKVEEVVKEEPVKVEDSAKVEKEDVENAEVEKNLPVLGHGQDKGLFTSEIFKVELGPIPKMIGYGDLKKFITKNLTMKPHKIKYVKQHRTVFICFQNNEERDLARSQLDGLNLKKETLVAKIAAAAQDKMTRKSRQDAKNEEPKKPDLRTTKEKLLDVTSPWRQIPYDKQVTDKFDKSKSNCAKISNLLKHATEYKGCPVSWPVENMDPKTKLSFPMEECIKADAINGYRNKCEFSYGLNEEKEKMVGFRVGRYTEQNLTVECARDVCIVRDSMKEALELCEQHIKNSKFDHYCPATYEGHWQTLMMRASGSDQDQIEDGSLKTDGKSSLVLTFTFIRNEVSEEDLEIARSEVKEIGEKCENVSGVVFYWKNTRGKEGERTLVYGSDLILAQVMGKKFEVSPDSFFQTHYHQCAKLYNELGTLGTKYCQKEKIRVQTISGFFISKAFFVTLEYGKVLLDICCGTGSIGIALSDYFDKVFGVDIVEEAIKDAEKNVKLNSLEDKCFFYAGNAQDKVAELCSKANQEELETVAIVDPPRAGLPKKVISVLRGNPSIESLIFVSCDSSNKMAQGNIVDLCKPQSKSLRGDPFRVALAKPVDLFPQTPHHELIFLLLRGGALQRWKEETKPRDFEKENEKKQNETEDAKKPASIPDSSELTVTSSL